MSDPTKELLWQAYLAGFKRSGEGWNGEYPFYKSDETAEKMKDTLRHGDRGFEEWFDQMNTGEHKDE